MQVKLGTSAVKCKCSQVHIQVVKSKCSVVKWIYKFSVVRCKVSLVKCKCS